jgi:hypothetical protein
MGLGQLLDLKHQGWQSLCNGTGSDFYGQLMTEGGVMVLAQGQVFSRQDVVDSLSEARPWRSYVIDQERLIRLEDSAAVLVYRGKAYRGDPSPAFVGLMSSTYVRRADGWALACYQQTPVPD